MKTKQPLTDAQKVEALKQLLDAVVKATHSGRVAHWAAVDRLTKEAASIILGRDATVEELSKLLY